MSDDNIITLKNLKTIHIPELQNRSGSVTLYYGELEDERESVEIKGSITLSEVCFLKECLEKYIRERMNEDA